MQLSEIEKAYNQIDLSYSLLFSSYNDNPKDYKIPEFKKKEYEPIELLERIINLKNIYNQFSQELSHMTDMIYKKNKETGDIELKKNDPLSKSPYTYEEMEVFFNKRKIQINKIRKNILSEIHFLEGNDGFTGFNFKKIVNDTYCAK